MKSKKLRLEEELEAKQWNGWQWALAILAFAGMVYGGIRFIEWAMR